MAARRPRSRASAPFGSRRSGGAAALVGAAAVTSGLAAYAYVAVGTHEFGSRGFAPIAVVWSVWSAQVAVVTFPVQHWIIRGLHTDPSGSDLSRELRVVAAGVALLAAASGVVTWLARDSLFHRASAVYPIVVAVSFLGSFAVGVSRGSLVGRGRVRAMAASVASENIIRLVVAVVVVIVGGGPVWFAAAIGAGFLVALGWPSALDLWSRRSGARAFLGRDLTGFVGASLIAQVLLNEAPVVVALLGRPDREVTAVFAAFALGRAPTLVVSFGSVVVMAEFARWFVAGRRDLIDRARRVVVVATVAVSSGAAGVAAAVGPAVLRAVFGRDVVVTAPVAAAVAAGCTVSIGALLLTLLLVAQRRGGAAGVGALVGLVIGIPITLWSRGTGADRVALGFLVAEIATLVILEESARRDRVAAASGGR